MEQQPHIIVPTAAVANPTKRVNRHAPMASCTLWVTPTRLARLFVLRVAERAHLTAVGHAIIHARRTVVATAGRDTPILCLTDKDAVWTTAEQAKTSRKDADGMPVWEELNTLSDSSSFHHRETKTVWESFCHTACYNLALNFRLDALAEFTTNPERYMVPGIIWSGWETPQAPLISAAAQLHHGLSMSDSVSASSSTPSMPP